MRRNYPYLGKQYLLDKNTLLVHDLDNEKPECRIGDILHEDIEMFVGIGNLTHSTQTSDTNKTRLCDKCFPVTKD